jgi:hypothetical protein
MAVEAQHAAPLQCCRPFSLQPFRFVSFVLFVAILGYPVASHLSANLCATSNNASACNTPLRHSLGIPCKP